MGDWRIMKPRRVINITIDELAGRIRAAAPIPYTGRPHDIGYHISELFALIGSDLIMNKRIGFDLHNSGSWHKSWYKTCDLFVGIADMLWEE
jgi:hypothetical protein